MNILVFGLAITSSWGNGHATTYRGLLKALAKRGHKIVFFEQWAEWYASNRDLDPADADYAEIVLYDDWHSPATQERAAAAFEQADLVIVGSYCAAGIAIAEWAIQGKRPEQQVIYYDIDTPVTLEKLRADGMTAYIRGDQLAQFDGVLSFTGGSALAELRERWGVRHVGTLYCGFDPEVHHPVAVDERFACALGYMGTYSIDRHDTVRELLLEPAQELPDQRFIIAGPQYPDVAAWPSNVSHISHLYPHDHAAFYSSNAITLNATRAQMVRAGYCPSVRLFEAAGCGACITSDFWQGLDQLFTPGEEILIAHNRAEMLGFLALPAAEKQRIGQAALKRALAEHTYEQRAKELEGFVDGGRGPSAGGRVG